MGRFFQILVAAILVLALGGCSGLRAKLYKKKATTTKQEEKSTNGQPKLVGIVDMVNPEQKYVLIRCEFALDAAVGRELVALDATGAQSKLSLSPERKGKYLTADIKSGDPKVTNLVLMYPQVSDVTKPQPMVTTAGGMIPGSPAAVPTSLTTETSPSRPAFGPAPVPKYNPDNEPPPPQVRRPPSAGEFPLPAGSGSLPLPQSGSQSGGTPEFEPVVR